MMWLRKLIAKIAPLTDRSKGNQSLIPVAKPMRTRLDYETKQGVRLSMVLGQEHIEGLQEAVPICVDSFRSSISPELFEKIDEQLDAPLGPYLWVSNLEASKEFSPLFPYEIPKDSAVVMVNSVAALPDNLKGWGHLCRKWFRYQFDITNKLVEFTQQELE
jgi:hypothetical protein